MKKLVEFLAIYLTRLAELLLFLPSCSFSWSSNEERMTLLLPIHSLVLLFLRTLLVLRTYFCSCVCCVCHMDICSVPFSLSFQQKNIGEIMVESGETHPPTHTHPAPEWTGFPICSLSDADEERFIFV